MIDKTLRQLKTSFIICIAVSILIFIADTLYTVKYVSPIGNIVLERWSIIVTLFGIFASLKLLHPKLKESDKNNPDTAAKTYKRKYYFRLLVLMLIYAFNIACLHFTGIKNFMFLALITIFALFLCAPNRQHVEAKNERD